MEGEDLLVRLGNAVEVTDGDGGLDCGLPKTRSDFTNRSMKLHFTPGDSENIVDRSDNNDSYRTLIQQGL